MQAPPLGLHLIDRYRCNRLALLLSVAATLLAGACSDATGPGPGPSASPELSAIGAPSFSQSANALRVWATKASMLGFTRSLAREVGRLGVTVNSVAPGFVDTAMTQNLDAEQRQQIERRSALRRLPDVDDVANAVEFILSDKAKSITGTVITVDAGNTA